MKSLEGYKTYIIAFLIGSVTVAYHSGYIDEGTWQLILGILNAGGISTLAQKMNRTEAKTEAIQNKM